MMTTQQIIDLSGHITWPLVALIALFVLRPFISQVARAASDLRELLDRSGEMVGLVSQLSELTEATADIRAMQEVALAARPDVVPGANQAAIEQLWKQFEKEWQETRDAFRAVAQSANVPVSFTGTIGVRNAAKILVDKGVIDAATAAAVVDQSAQYQYMYRTTANRAEILNANVVAAYSKTGAQVRQALKSRG